MLKKILRFYERYFLSDILYARKKGVTIGDHCKISSRYFGSEPYLIEIGNHVQITQDVRFANHGAGWVLRNKYPDFDFFGKIKIGNNVYIGNSTIILPGIVIGNNVIVGAGSVVTKSIPDDTIVGGNPARVITSMQKFENSYIKFNTHTKGLSAEQKKQILLKMSDDKFISK